LLLLLLLLPLALVSCGPVATPSRPPAADGPKPDCRVEFKRNENVKLTKNTNYWRKLLTEAGFDIKQGDSPIVPVMLYNAKLAQDVSRDLFAEGIYVVGFFFPVVAKAQARIRTQLSAAHDKHHLDTALAAFKKVGKRLGVI
jgi:7-keto-8-aminopelargonate synthetase-like enzyme